MLLMDAFITSSVIANLDNSKRVVINTSETFDEATERPWSYGISYILLANPDGIGALDIMNVRHPTLYRQGADWCEELEEIRGLYKVFRVTQ